MLLKSSIFLLCFKRPMCLNHSKYYIRMTFSLFADNPETYEKNFWKLSKQLIKIHENRSWQPSKWRLEKERKKTSKNNGKYRKWTPKWEPRRGHFLVIWLLFSVPDGLGSPNGSQASPKSPQDQSKPRFPSIVGWFWTIFWWFSVSCGLLFIWFASLLFWLPRAFIFKFLATSSNVLGSSAGVSKVTKKCED